MEPWEDDSACIRAVLSGDGDAFEHLVRRYHKSLHYFVAGKIHGDAEAEDIVQQAFISAYHSLAEYDQARPFKAWIFGVAMNHCRNEWRKRKREADLHERLLEARQAELLLESLESDDLVHEDRLKALRLCMEGLSKTDKQVIQARFVEETPLEELGKQLSKTSEAVRLLLFRIRGRLGECVRRRLAGAVS